MATSGSVGLGLIGCGGFGQFCLRAFRQMEGVRLAAVADVVKEIGNASTWSSCTHREVQVPTSWSAGSISVDVNQGTFSDGGGAYLYVVDADGEVNSNGYAIDFAD